MYDFFAKLFGNDNYYVSIIEDPPTDPTLKDIRYNKYLRVYHWCTMFASSNKQIKNILSIYFEALLLV